MPRSLFSATAGSNTPNPSNCLWCWPKKRHFHGLLIVASALMLQVTAVHAGLPLDSYRNSARGKEAVAPIGPDAFGEQVDLSTGVTRFQVTDVSAATNSGIPMTVGRVLDLTAPNLQTSDGDNWEGSSSTEPEKHVFGTYWDLDVPYMRGVFDARKGWLSDIGDPIVGSPARCSNGFKPQNVQGVFPFHQTTFLAKDYWHGIQVNIPGIGSDDLLNHIPGQQEPNDGQLWRGATKSGSRVRCKESIQNGTGEGFIVAAPNGLKYTFDWMASRRAPSITSRGSWSISNAGAWVGPPDPSANNIISSPPSVMVPRVAVYLYATRIEDQFGNFVSYQYDSANPFRLLSISSNDGQLITMTYNSDGRIQTITNGTRTWTYQYEAIWYKQLSRVTLPDASNWQFSYENLYFLNSRSERSDQLWSNCVLNLGSFISGQTPHPDDTRTINMRHPSGLNGEFRFRRLAHGHNRVPGGCGSSSGTYFSVAPTVFLLPSLYQKTLTGPGIGSRSWSLSYAPTYSFETACSPNCASVTSTTTVTEPGSIVKVYTFGNDYHNNAGQLLQETISDSSGLLRTTNYAFVTSASGQAFPESEGIDPHLGNNPFKTKNRPLFRRVITQDGATFTWEATTFNRWAQPAAQFASSSLGYSQNRLQTTRDDLDIWVLNQPASQTVGSILVEGWDYDPITARPSQQRGSGGRVIANFTYYPDGNLHQSTDGTNRTTTFENWYRGVPKTIRYADSSQVSATVDQLGLVRTFTDELVRTTAFDYDGIGRLSQVTPPSNPLGTSWSGSTISFAPSVSSAYGLPAGHWVQTISRGDWRQETRFNALWQPVLTRESSSSGANARFVVINYDSQDRESFRSYALSALNQITDANLGISSTYDGLDRLKTVTQTSEDGPLVTTHQWLSGFKKRIQNPRLFQTTIEYQVYDLPDESWPNKVIAPAGQTTVILRDDVGKPLSISRMGLIAGTSVTVDRKFIYDNFERLCVREDPERGEQVLQWDAANNLTWSAHGLQGFSSRGILDCPRELVPTGERIQRTYDARHRLTGIDFPDQTADIGYTWHADGALKTASRDGSTWTYSWNSLGLVYRETLAFAGKTRQFQHDYNSLGQETALTYPDGHVVDYSPNVLGQPLQVGSYASGINWHPNGQLASASLSNGVSLSRELNTRRALSRIYYSRSSTPLVDLRYGYDANGNVDDIDDQAQAGVDDQTFAWDGLDRIIGATAPGSYQSAIIEYDVFDNIRRQTLGARDLTYQYNTQNQLSGLALPNGTTVLSTVHDARGNVVQSGGTTLQFDRADTLRQIDSAQHKYDAHGNRVQITSNGQTRYPIYTLDGLLRMEYGSEGDDRYVYLGRNILARTRNESTDLFRDGFESNQARLTTGIGPDTWYLTDHLGSSIATANAAGTILERSQFAPFGERWNKSFERGIGFTGHFEDSAGLTYMRARYYSVAGQFLSTDSVDVDTQFGGNFNRYWYANNNPHRYIDPNGLISKEMAEEFNRTAQVERAKQPWDRLVEYGLRSIESAFDDFKIAAESIDQGNPSSLAIIGFGLNFTPAGPESTPAKKIAYEILEIDRDVFVVAFEGAKGKAVATFNFIKDGDTAILARTHIEGKGTLKEAVEIARQFGRDVGAKRLVIEPGRRENGARPGHTPRKLEIEL